MSLEFKRYQSLRYEWARGKSIGSKIKVSDRHLRDAVGDFGNVSPNAVD
jgi:hypothetical protein